MRMRCFSYNTELNAVRIKKLLWQHSSSTVIPCTTKMAEDWSIIFQFTTQILKSNNRILKWKALTILHGIIEWSQNDCYQIESLYTVAVFDLSHPSSLPIQLHNQNQDAHVEEIIPLDQPVFCSQYIFIPYLKNGKRNVG